MITHLFNSSSVSGPETLTIPSLLHLGEPVNLIFLTETRLQEESQKPIEYAKKMGYEVFQIPVKSRFDREAFKMLRDCITEIHPRIVHAHDVKASFYLHHSIRKNKGFKPFTVSTHHGASFRKGKNRLYEELYVRFILPHFDQVLSVCRADQRSIIRRGVNKDRVALHLNGIEGTPTNETNRSEQMHFIRESWKIKNPSLPHPEHALFFGAVARLSTEKRHDKMIKMISEYTIHHPNSQKIVLLFFGVGPEEENLKKLSAELKMEQTVFFMGYSQTINQEMAGFDLLLSFSDGEGIPINLLEGGYAQTPIFSTNVGGIPDLICTEELGYLFHKSDNPHAIMLHLMAILNDAPKMMRVGVRFQKHIMNHFTRVCWLKRLRDVYAQLTYL